MAMFVPNGWERNVWPDIMIRGPNLTGRGWTLQNHLMLLGRGSVFLGIRLNVLSKSPATGSPTVKMNKHITNKS